jgi:hypothetical protein
MNNFSSHDSVKRTSSMKSAVIVVFPLERAHLRASLRLCEVTISATEDPHGNVVPLRRDHAAESAVRLLQLRIRQAAIFALKLRGEFPRNKADHS